MAFTAYFDSPDLYENRFDFYADGASPGLLKELINYLEAKSDSLKEIYVAFYLYNNKYLDECLVNLAAKGIKVTVITIPMEGYDTTNPKSIKDLNTGRIVGSSSKYDLAREIYGRHYTQSYENFSFLLFPHMYLRSENVKPFSRGNMPYSLHLKTILCIDINNRDDLVISSSNFAVRDLVKEENMLVVSDEKEFTSAAAPFFELLRSNSIPIKEFDFQADYTSYEIVAQEYDQADLNGFMAPFYYDSPLKVEDRLAKLIQGAKNRILVVGQHVCAVDYSLAGEFYSNRHHRKLERDGIADALVEKAKQGVDLKILSQTFARGQESEDKKFRTPANVKSFIEFYNKLDAVENVAYWVNENCHSKYIVIDDQVLVSTFNYTPTQFIYLDQVKIKNFKYNPGKKYSGTYSEVGAFVLVNDKNTVDSYVGNFYAITKKNASIKVR